MNVGFAQFKENIFAGAVWHFEISEIGFEILYIQGIIYNLYINMRQVILHRRDNIRAKLRQSNVSLYGGQCSVKWFQSTVEPLQYQFIPFLFTCSSNCMLHTVWL